MSRLTKTLTLNPNSNPNPDPNPDPNPKALTLIRCALVAACACRLYFDSKRGSQRKSLSRNSVKRAVQNQPEERRQALCPVSNAQALFSAALALATVLALASIALAAARAYTAAGAAVAAAAAAVAVATGVTAATGLYNDGQDEQNKPVLYSGSLR